MRQRVMIAIALSCNPKLLLADEPTTALDVTIQAQILRLMKSLSAEYNAAVIVITHDLGVVAGMCRRILVMYAGRIVEEGPASRSSITRTTPTRSVSCAACRVSTNRARRSCKSIEGCRPTSRTLPPAAPSRRAAAWRPASAGRRLPELFPTTDSRRSACYHADRLIAAGPQRRGADLATEEAETA